MRAGWNQDAGLLKRETYLVKRFEHSARYERRFLRLVRREMLTVKRFGLFDEN